MGRIRLRVSLGTTIQFHLGDWFMSLNLESDSLIKAAYNTPPKIPPQSKLVRVY